MTPFSRFLMSFRACILTLLAIMMLVKDVDEGYWWKTCMLVKTKLFSWKYFSPTYRKIFTNTLHQHTFKFLFIFSPTCKKNFTNILHQHTFKFLSSPTYSFTNIQKILHQHTFFRQHISPTSLQSSSHDAVIMIFIWAQKGKMAFKTPFAPRELIWYFHPFPLNLTAWVLYLHLSTDQ